MYARMYVYYSYYFRKFKQKPVIIGKINGVPKLFLFTLNKIAIVTLFIRAANHCKIDSVRFSSSNHSENTYTSSRTSLITKLNTFTTRSKEDINSYYNIHM